jgi:hypothetical protein
MQTEKDDVDNDSSSGGWPRNYGTYGDDSPGNPVAVRPVVKVELRRGAHHTNQEGKVTGVIVARQRVPNRQEMVQVKFDSEHWQRVFRGDDGWFCVDDVREIGHVE